MAPNDCVSAQFKLIYFAQVWFLRMVSTSKQVSQLLIDKQFELAIRLCNLATNDNLQQRTDKIREIQTLLAFDQVRIYFIYLYKLELVSNNFQKYDGLLILALLVNH